MPVPCKILFLFETQLVSLLGKTDRGDQSESGEGLGGCRFFSRDRV